MTSCLSGGLLVTFSYVLASSPNTTSCPASAGSFLTAASSALSTGTVASPFVSPWKDATT
jgi:hypothetical protein